MITVYGAPPTRALRVVWMLEEMELPYELRAVDFARRLEDSEFMAASPTGAFPALRDGDTRLMESCAILEYLGAKFGPTPLAPGINAPNYPAYISFLHFGETSLAAPLNVTVGSRFFGPEAERENFGARLAVAKSAALLGPLSRGPYLAGDFTAADISCGWALGLGHWLGFHDRLAPPLQAYVARLAERPAYQRAMSRAQPLV
ncbi:glutathione S-transferase family protein [Enterovirga aerilata]|uniref:Glutathione S-transferase family protein n=1 Tax=Enterovirga aerilata TaxID=2730920 RepID=A0A849I8Q2_9HYPH|nr:glutathione S-transferase family protein [Enterovirga sp. DB1703]NNM72377.1 glutathione S-transferase family protein [Enterovirga sp. DB1703]